MLSHSPTDSRSFLDPPLPISAGRCPTPRRKECCTEKPRRIWTDRLCWVSPLSLLALGHAFLSNHTSTWLSMLQPCLCNSSHEKGQASEKSGQLNMWRLAEVSKNVCACRRAMHSTAWGQRHLPGEGIPPFLVHASLCLSGYLYAFRYPQKASKHSDINVSLGSVRRF